MGLASEHELPTEKKHDSPWTSRRLFPVAAAVKNFSKLFVNSFDVMCFLNILILGICEIFDKDIAWGLYLLPIFLISSSIFERHLISKEIIKQK